MPKILNGKALAQVVAQTSKLRVEKLVTQIGRKPGLAVILVGDNPASQTYVASKTKAALAAGLAVLDHKLPPTTTSEALGECIVQLNNNPEVDGILLQLPLPPHLDGNAFVNMISPKKDADGLHPFNQGILLQGGLASRSCTPLGTMALLDLALSSIDLTPETNISDLTMNQIPKASLAGKSAVVIGRSLLVGKPVGLLLLERNATVTYAHSKTADLKGVCLQADILVAAVGVPELVKGDWVKPGAIVLDVGINRIATGKLVGDVEFSSAAARASAITPVPGGVGPMTVAMLISNTIDNYERLKK